MPIISVRDNEHNRWMRNAKIKKTKTKQQKQQQTHQEKSNLGDRSYSEWERDKWFCCAPKLSPINIKSFFNF